MKTISRAIGPVHGRYQTCTWGGIQMKILTITKVVITVFIKPQFWLHSYCRFIGDCGHHLRQWSSSYRWKFTSDGAAFDFTLSSAVVKMCGSWYSLKLILLIWNTSLFTVTQMVIGMLIRRLDFFWQFFFHFTIGAFQTDLTLFNQRGGNRHLNLQKKLNVEEFFRYHFPLL